MSHDHIHGHGLIGLVLTAVVRGHAEGIGDFSFTEEFTFGGGGHVDDVGGDKGAVEAGFGPGGELRSLFNYSLGCCVLVA